MRFLFLLELVIILFRCDVYGQFRPPKIETQEIEQLSKSEIPTISYCELGRSPTTYNQKFVRVHGVYVVVGGEYSNLYDLSCLSNPTREEKLEIETQTWVSFDHSFKSQTKPEILKLFELLNDSERLLDVTV